MIIGIGVTYFSEEAIKILTTKEYHKAIWITPIFIFYYLFAIVGYLTKMQVLIAEKNKFLIPGTIVSGITNIILNLTLIPVYGMIGAAIAAAFTSLVSQLFVFYYGMKVFPLEINKRKLLKLYGLLFVSLEWNPGSCCISFLKGKPFPDQKRENVLLGPGNLKHELCWDQRMVLARRL